MHAKPDLRVVLKWTIAGSGSVIANVTPFKQSMRHRFRYSLSTMIIVSVATSVLVAIVVQRQKTTHKFYQVSGRIGQMVSAEIEPHLSKCFNMERVPLAMDYSVSTSAGGLANWSSALRYGNRWEAVNQQLEVYLEIVTKLNWFETTPSVYIYSYPALVNEPATNWLRERLQQEFGITPTIIKREWTGNQN